MAKARRFGNIRKLPSGRYQARWQGQDGIERRAPSTFADAKAARTWLSEQETDRFRGRWVDPAKGRRRFGEYFETTWLVGRAGDLRPRTEELYRWLYRKLISPTFERVEVAEIDVAAVTAWRGKLRRDGVGDVSIAKAYRLLRTVLNTAVAEGLIVANPCTLKGAGVEKSPERRPATIPQVLALADAIDPPYRLMVLLATFAGLRFGELAALTRERFDLERGTVEVIEAAGHLADGTRIVGAPKSAAGRRRISLPAALVAEASDHLDLYVGSDPRALVFKTPTGMPLRGPNFHHVWARAREAAGALFPPKGLDWLHFHDLRHTGNTMAAMTGASTAELMSRMGHSTSRAALIYQHATENRDKAIATSLGDMITQARPVVPGTVPNAQLEP